MRISFMMLLLALGGCRTLGNVGGSFVSNLTVHSSYRPYSELAEASVEESRTNEEGSMKGGAQTFLTFSVGSYFHRDGILEGAGNLGPTIGLEAGAYSLIRKRDDLFHMGYYLFWTFDHFWDTNSELLDQKYWNEDHTNYMLTFGPAFELRPLSWLFFGYQPGFALNFLEMDTNRTNTSASDDEFTDLTFSITHKIYMDFVSGEPKDRDGSRIGLAVFTYWIPHPLGKFLNDDYKDTSPANSWSWLLQFKTEYW